MSKLLSVEPRPDSIRPVPAPSGQERAASPEQLEKEHMEAKVHLQMLERTDANINRLNTRLERLEGQLDQWTEPTQQAALRAPTPPAPITRRGNLAAALVIGVIGGAIASYLVINHWAAISQGIRLMGAPSPNFASPEHAQTAEIAAIEEPALQAQPSIAIVPDSWDQQEGIMAETSEWRPWAVQTQTISSTPAHALETETPESASEPAQTQKADAGPIAPAPSDAAPAPEPSPAQTAKSADPRDSAASQRSAKPAMPRYRVIAPSDGRIAL